MDNLIDELIDDKSDTRRERLATLIAGGQSKQYLGKSFTIEELDSLSDDELTKLYSRYEARLGATMTQTLGQAALQIYTTAAGLFLPIPRENLQPLMTDLESDPFVRHALNSAACNLYYRYGAFLAPLTAALTTLKYCQFKQQVPIENNDDGDTTGNTTGNTTGELITTYNESNEFEAKEP